MKKENLFAHIDTLDEPKPYICPKAVSTRDWENICMECKGKCDAGKRAIQILDEATKPDIPKKAGKGIISDAMRQGAKVYNEKKQLEAIAGYRGVFRQAIENDQNPVALLAEVDNVSYHTARQRLDYFIKQHPEIDAELHMRETMNKYVKRRKSRKANAAEVLPEPDTDEISIGDILKAADEGFVKTDSVEETESGIKIHAHVEPGEAVPFHEGDSWIDSDIKRKLLEQFAEDCDAGAVHLPHWGDPGTRLFPDGKGSFRVVGDIPKAADHDNADAIEATEPNDNVNRPGHYTFGAIEVIDYIRDKMPPEMFQGFCMGNVLKYVSRHKHKNGVEDLKKANVYLGWLIESEEGAK